MRNRIKKESTLVYQGGVKVVAKKSTTETIISKYYELSTETDHKARLKDAWGMYKMFKLKSDLGKVGRDLI